MGWETSLPPYTLTKEKRSFKKKGASLIKNKRESLTGCKRNGWIHQSGGKTAVKEKKEERFVIEKKGEKETSFAGERAQRGIYHAFRQKRERNEKGRRK